MGCNYRPFTTAEAVAFYGMKEGNVVRVANGDGLLIHDPRLDGKLCVFMFGGGRKTFHVGEVERVWANIGEWLTGGEYELG